LSGTFLGSTMGYTISESLLLRAPAGSWQSYKLDPQLHLANTYLLAAIYIASPQFYQCLENKRFDYAQLTAKEQFTFRKYVNRFCFRPTPFGLFSGVTLLKWAEISAIDLPEISANHLRILPDLGTLLALSQELLHTELSAPGSFEINPSLYRLVDEYRFISSELEPGIRERKYLLQSMDYSILLKELTYYCRVSRSGYEIIGELRRLAVCSEQDAIEHFEFLKDEQFLVETRRPTINGPGHVESLLALISKQQIDSSRVKAWQALFGQLSLHHPIAPAYFQKLNHQLQQLSANTNSVGAENHLNVTINRQVSQGSLSIDHQAQLRDALFALNCLSIQEPVTAMNQFVQNFNKYFEGRSLALLYALDPEVGLGYAGQEAGELEQLIATLDVGANAPADHSAKWTPAHRLLLETWHDASDRRPPVIELREEKLRQLASASDELDTLGLSVLFRINGDDLFLESAGGVNAVALLGRFSIANPEITTAIRQTTQQQEAANPHVIFAEVLHLSNSHIDNINRRETFWSYEIPLTAASTLPVERQIPLADLRVKVEDGRVYLYSEKYRKIVIPRLSTAYNHTIDQLPIFRFLIDLAYQYGKHSLGLELSQYFPGVSYYPRVAYKKTILSLATWVLSEKELQLFLVAGDDDNGLAALEAMVTQLGLPKVFSLAEGDQQLVFFRDWPGDLRFLSACVRQKQQVILKEFLLDDAKKSLVNDQSKAPLINQFSAMVLPDKAITVGSPGVAEASLPKHKRTFMPGSEWLYLKIYISKIGSTRLLLKILPLLRRRYPAGPVKRWFFVRYNDHAPHIRLRMEIAPDNISPILIAFKKALEDGVTQHVIREYQVDVYSRELERYRAGGISLTEDFFCRSSELIVRSLKAEQHEPIPGYQLAVRSVLDMIQLFIEPVASQIAFTEFSYRQFLPEFEGKVKVELDWKYRELRTEVNQLLLSESFYRDRRVARPGKAFVQSIRALAATVPKDSDERDDYLRSLIHMHVNRLFATEPRKQEMVVYYFLHKFLVSLNARNPK
jgi:thiopeptide-type bacteriocin biosynthesis protein